MRVYGNGQIDRETWGKQTVSSVIGDMRIYDAPTYYSGIACFCGVEAIINMLIQGRGLAEHFIGLTNTIRKMYEYQSLILLSLKYIQKKWQIEDLAIHEDVDVYASCCEQLQRWQNMSLKYEMSGDKNILHRILDDIFHVFKKERTALQRFQDTAFKWYEEKNIS